MEGKIDIQPTSANNKKSNLSTINAKKEQPQHRTRKDILNISAFEQAIQNAKRQSKQDLNGDESNKNLSKPRRKSKSKEGNKSISQNIKKFMEKKKNAHLQLKSLEQTIENQKNSKIKENLKSLHQFAKQHFRHQSYNFYPKKNNAGLINMHNLESDSSKALPLKKLKPQFFKTKQKKKSSDKLSKKVFDFKGDTIFDHDQKDHIDDDQSIHRDEADISQEFYEDYQRVIRAQKNNKRRQNAGDQSSSVEHSPLRNKSSSKKQKRIKQVFQSQLQNELEQSLILNQKARYSQNDSNIISIDQQQYQSMKNDIAQMPSVVQEKGASLIPPQSDIATLERNYMDRSQNRHFDSTEKRRFTDNRRSQDSGIASNKSPKLSEQKQKMRLLMSRYGHNLSSSQINAPQADKKLLIKLHSAAITIQQQIRDYLQRKGFYYLGSSNSQSNMYIDSEEDQNNYNYDLSDQKSVQKQLVAQTSPLRVKSKYQQQQFYQKVPQHFENQQKQNKFYSADSSDVEKVIVCSVITSGRADNDESLQNTQKYIPLRQKSVAPIPQQKPQPQVKPQLQFSAQIQQQQQQLQQNKFERPQPQTNNKISSASSSAQSGFNTVIKTQQIPLQQRLQSESLHESLDISQQSSSSQRKKIVPSLDFGKLKPKEESKEQVAPIIHKQEEEYKIEQPGSNTARSMFERHSFQDFSQKVHSGEPFNVNNYPEMLKMREEAIKYKEIEEQKLLQKMVKTKQMSPRTYDIKRKELESWVSKEKEEVKKTKRVFEEQWQKTTQIIEQTKKNHDLMKKMFNDNPSAQSNAHNHHINQIYKTNDSIPSEHTMQNIQQSHRQSSRRDTTHLLDMIDDYPKQDSTMKQKEDLQLELLKKQYQAEQQKKEQERQRQLDEERIKKEQERKKEMDMLKELEKQREEERQKQLVEQERKIKEENERQKEAERKRLLEFEKEKERLKQEEAERQRKILEEKKQKELQERLLEEKRQRELQEQQRKEREEQQRLRDLEIQRKQEEERKQREALAQKKLEEELKKKQEDDERRKRELEEQKRKAEQEEALRIQKQKELEAQKKKELEEQQRKIEEQARLKKEKEEQEKQRQLEFMRELEEIEKAKKAQAELDKKLKEERDREIEREKQERQRQEREEHERMMQELNQESDRYADSSDKDDTFQRNFNDSSDDEMFMNQMENKLLDNILHEPKRGKEVLESQEDEKMQNDSNLLDISRHHHQRNIDELPRDEEPRGLSRTRSSQYLNENKFEDDMNDMLQVSRDNLQELEQSETRIQDPSNLNDVSMDEELLAEQLLRSQEQKNQALGNLVLNDSFFSKNFDDQRPEDLINLFHKQLDDGTLDQTNEISKTVINTSAEKIFVQDGGEETKDESSVIEPKFKFDDKKNQRLSQEMRNQIPVEEEEHVNPGMPVSPVSQDGNDIRIQTGAQSLESTLSDGNEFRNAIQEAQKQDAQVSASDIDQNVERITDDIFRQLLAEMKVELDLLLLTDPRRMLREEANSNQFLSESGRFLIFERRGIKTDLFAIEHYVEEVLEEILKDRERFNQSISQPISKNANEVLNQLQNSEIGSYEHFDVNYPQVLPLDLYLKLEKRRKENRELQNPQENNQPNGDRNNQDRNFLAECEHIHNKVLFDCINDSLLQFKPYGRDGMPLPWSRQNRRLKPIEEFTTEEMFEIVKHDLFRWAIMQAGTLPRRDFVFNNLFDDELFAEIREKKLATLLAREMIENEPKWLNYEFEEAQVKIDIGDMILEQLVTETITILRQNQGLAE